MRAFKWGYIHRLQKNCAFLVNIAAPQFEPFYGRFSQGINLVGLKAIFR